MHRLKDSDVTWLYGPLHPGVDWYPLAEKDSGADDTHQSPSVSSPYTKPILKHRSIGDLLSRPPVSHDEEDEPESTLPKDVTTTRPSPESRPPLLHTKSDTNLARRNLPQSLRKDSPPRIIAANPDDEVASVSTATSSEQDLVPSNSHTGKKKHISFNTFVEQCIAIEKPKQKRANTIPKTRFAVASFDDDMSVLTLIVCVAL